MQNKAELWQFPCDFPIKVVGKANPEFEAFVYATVHKFFPDLMEGSLQTRLSKDGTYLAVTLIVPATSKEQLDAMYIELTANEQVIIAL